VLISGIVDDTLRVGRIIVNGGVVATGVADGSQEVVSEAEDKNILPFQDTDVIEIQNHYGPNTYRNITTNIKIIKNIQDFKRAFL